MREHASTANVLDLPLAENTVPFVRVHPSAPHSFEEQLKRRLDILCSLLLIVLFLPVMGIIALVIALSSSGGVIYKQSRKGRYEQPFHVYKFRTMFVGSHAVQDQLRGGNTADGILFKLKQDPRTTRVGKWLRLYSLDELPQLFNVLKGEMSLVGPRPFDVREFDRGSSADLSYQRWIRDRHQVRPGITGLWQVSGRNDLPFRELVRLDLQYVYSWNVLGDFIILLKTIGAVIHKQGAY